MEESTMATKVPAPKANHGFWRYVWAMIIVCIALGAVGTYHLMKPRPVGLTAHLSHEDITQMADMALRVDAPITLVVVNVPERHEVDGFTYQGRQCFLVQYNDGAGNHQILGEDCNSIRQLKYTDKRFVSVAYHPKTPD